jgi:hypothetical protein
MFDRYVTVDWSASNSPRRGQDSIWICVLDTDHEVFTLNPRTRATAEDSLRDLLVDTVASGRRALVGCDFPFGYPTGFAAALQLGEPAWLSVWDYLGEHVRNDTENRNNRFDVASDINRRLLRHAFWGCPLTQRFEHLSARRDHACYSHERDTVGLREWRAVEQVLRSRGRQPHSTWKLLGAGSVGSQSLTGIPVLARLRQHPVLRTVCRVWPFEVVVPDLQDGRPGVILAEVWPSLIDLPFLHGLVKDEAQVIGSSEALHEEDRDGRLGALFAAGESPPAAEEGWILGVLP